MEPIKPNFKYMLNPDNLYIVDFGDFSAEIYGKDIIDVLLDARSTKYVKKD